MDRRTYLAGTLAVALAGCTGDEPGSDSPSADTDQSATDGNPDEHTSDESPADENATDANDEAASDPEPFHEDYDSTEVTIRSPDGDRLGAVTAAIADTGELRRLGLSDTEALPEDRGMLFVYDEVQDFTFWMREMDFGIDIVFIDADGTITSIHHAPAPGPDEDGRDQRYSGHGQYVLEVNYEWTTARNVTEGDVVSFDLPE